MKTPWARGVLLCILMALLAGPALGQISSDQPRLQIRVSGPQRNVAEVLDPATGRWLQRAMRDPVLANQSSPYLAIFATHDVAIVYDRDRGGWLEQRFSEVARYIPRFTATLSGPPAVADRLALFSASTQGPLGGATVAWLYNGRLRMPWVHDLFNAPFHNSAVGPNVAAVFTRPNDNLLAIYDAVLDRWIKRTWSPIWGLSVKGDVLLIHI